MRILSKLIGLLIPLATAGCASMPPVQLTATPADMELLAGDWHGEYTSPALGRRGTIDFRLNAGRNQAKGVVAMMPQGATKPYEPSSLEKQFEGNGLSSQLLTIRFVQADNGELRGALDPYWDPDRNCQATTRFDGYLKTGFMEGTFYTTWDCGSGEATGQWHVTRKTPKQSAGGRHVD